MEFSRVADPALKAGLRRHEIRILHLAELHHFLSRGAGRDEIEAADYFQPLCGVLSRSILEPLGLRCEAFVGEGVLDGSACEWLGLIISELVMNAAKHAFPGRTEGCVRIEISAPDGMAWCCTVADNGCGIGKTAAGGTGSQIVDTLVQMLDGQMAVDTGSSGTTIVLRFPATHPKSAPLTSRDDRASTAGRKV